MKDIEFQKKCNVATLTAELVAAGFDIYGCSNIGNVTTVHLKDTEAKNPSDVVAAHIYMAPNTTPWNRTSKLLDKLKEKGVITQTEYNDVKS